MSQSMLGIRNSKLICPLTDMEEIMKTFEVCFKVLKFYGLWLDGRETLRYRIRGFSCIIFGIFAFWAMLFAGICKREISLEMAHSITFLIASTVVFLRCFDFILKIHRIKELYDQVLNMMEKYVKNDNFVKKRLKFYLRVFITIIFNSYVSVSSGFLISFKSHRYPYPIAVPFNIDDTEIGFYAVNIYISISLCYIAPVYVILGWYPMFFMNFIIGVMEDFNERLENFGKSIMNINNENEKEKLYKKELHEIIEIHEIIREFVIEFTKIYKLTFFMKGIAGSIILCTVLFVIPLVSI
jgi:hypothetical protein